MNYRSIIDLKNERNKSNLGGISVLQNKSSYYISEVDVILSSCLSSAGRYGGGLDEVSSPYR